MSAQRIVVRVLSEKNQLPWDVGGQDTERPAPGFPASSGRELGEQRIKLRDPADEPVQLGDHDYSGIGHPYIVA